MLLNSMNNALSKDLISLMPLINNWWTNKTISELYLTTWYGAYENDEFVVFDTETKWFRDEIIEIGAIIVKNNKIKNKNWKFYDYSYYINNNGEKKWEMDAFAFFVYPAIPEIPEFITELTHIDMKIIEDGLQPWAKDPNRTLPDFVTAFTQFIDFIWNRTIIAHNARFDTWIFRWSLKYFYDDINRSIRNQDHPLTLAKVKQFFSLNVIDTLTEAQRAMTLNPNINYKNSTLSDFFWLPSNEALLHRAVYDVIFTTRNFYWLYEYTGSTYENIWY